MTRRRLVAAMVASAALLAPATAPAQTLPPLDISKLTYQPEGFFKAGDPIPADYGKACESIAGQRTGKIFNPSGHWSAFDNTIFEYFCLPYRNQDDVSASDPDGNGGESAYGYCKDPDPTDPLAQSGPEGAGTCPNHQLEYIDYFKTTMLEILKDYNPTFHEYEFEHEEGVGRNPAVIVAGADHPDEHIIIGSHYDQTKTGPASLWDSQEGHAEMIRVAKLMADYWKATGTRPSATIKFMPTDGEEDGSLGSADYVSNTVTPGQEAKVRSYWNADPCAGGYPARRYGNPAEVIPINIQIGDDPDARVQEFNGKVPAILEQTLDHIDDKINVYADQTETFISTAENAVTTDVGKYLYVSTDHPVLFSSDWTNFIAAKIPFFNPTPKVTGPSNPNGAAVSPYQAMNNYPDAILGFHTPMDNLQTMSRFTGQDVATGNQYPEAYIKGMEFCSHLLAWGMLQPFAGGAQTSNADPVPYYEVAPNEVRRGLLTAFDASGSYQYADPATHSAVADADLQYKWDFGDGSKPAFGKFVKHAYAAEGVFQSKLTLTNRKSGAAKSMVVPVTVVEGTGRFTDPPGQDVDSLPAAGTIVACTPTSGFAKLSVKPAGKGLKFAFTPAGGASKVKIDVLRAGTGRKAAAPKRVARFTVTKSFSWNGKLRKGRPAAGTYFVRVSAQLPDNRIDRRAFALTRTGSRFRLRKPFETRAGCGLISAFRLGSPAFGGKRALDIGFATTQAGTAVVSVYRGRTLVKRVRRTIAQANRLELVKVVAKKLRRGEYRVVLKVSAGGATRTASLYARRL